MSVTLEDLGLTKEELQERVVERLAVSLGEPDEANLWEGSPVWRKLKEATEKRIDQAIDKLAEEHIFPGLTTLFERLTLQKTNEWGEKKGEPVTFLEYLTRRAETYFQEKVNHEGSTESHRGSRDQTRASFLIHTHLMFTLKSVIQNAVAEANRILIGGIQETCKIKLGEIAETLKVSVKTGK